MLQNEPLDVKKLVDTAENGPLQSPKSRVCGAGSGKEVRQTSTQQFQVELV